MANSKEERDEMASHIARLKANLQAAERADEPEDDDGAEEVSIDDEDEDEIDVAPAARVSRDEKKRNRFKEAKEAADRADEQRIAAERRAAAAEERARLTEGALQHATQQRQQTQQAPEDQMIGQTYREEEFLAKDFQEKVAEYRRKNVQMPDQEHQNYLAKAREISDRRDRAKYQKFNRENGIGPAPTPAQQALTARHADVFANNAAAQWATHQLESLKIERNVPISPELIDEAMDMARKKFNIGRKQEDTSLRNRLGGSPKGSVGRPATDGRRTVKMTKAFQQMANAKYPHIKDKTARFKAWAKSYLSGADSE